MREVVFKLLICGIRMGENYREVECNLLERQLTFSDKDSFYCCE